MSIIEMVSSSCIDSNAVQFIKVKLSIFETVEDIVMDFKRLHSRKALAEIADIVLGMTTSSKLVPEGQHISCVGTLF